MISNDFVTNTRLLLSMGNKKPKLTTITIEQYSIASLRIFHELICLNRLPTMSHIREYFSYSIKIYELARKYSWEPVLQFDDEFRILQHMYGYPWSHDHSHLHEIMLIPRWAEQSTQGGKPISFPTPFSSGKLQGGATFVSHNATGMEICRNFNRIKGCSKVPCRFAHICNRRVGNQACGKSHAGHTHPSSSAPPSH